MSKAVKRDTAALYCRSITVTYMCDNQNLTLLSFLSLGVIVLKLNSGQHRVALIVEC